MLNDLAEALADVASLKFKKYQCAIFTSPERSRSCGFILNEGKVSVVEVRLWVENIKVTELASFPYRSLFIQYENEKLEEIVNNKIQEALIKYEISKKNMNKWLNSHFSA